MAWQLKENPLKTPARYKRKGTRSLLASYEVETNKVIGAMFNRKRPQEVLKFFEKLRRNYPTDKLYIILDNFSAHKHKNVGKWIEEDGAVELVFLPTNSSWLNRIEPFFGNLKKFTVVGSDYESKKELDKGLLRYISYHNRKKAKGCLKKVA